MRRGLRRPLRGFGAAVGARLLSFTSPGATFTRASSATYQTGASTIAVVASDIIRPEDYGDGNGAVFLFEGAATNYALRSESFDNGAWTANNETVSANATAAPDGATTADRITAVATGLATDVSNMFQSIVGAAPSSSMSASVWIKRAVTSQTTGATALGAFTGGPPVIASQAIGDAWSRVFTSNTGLISTVFLGVSQQSASGTSVAGDNLDVWGMQCETGLISTSYIPTAGASVTRAADSLTFSSGNWPTYMGTQRWAFDFYPIAAHGAYTAATVLFSFGDGSNEIRLTSAHEIEIETVDVLMTTPAMTWARGTKITVIVDPENGTIITSGALTGNDTTTDAAWTWPTNVTLRVGGRVGAASEARCRISEPRKA